MLKSADEYSDIREFVSYAQSLRSKDANEANTRHKIIDTVIHEILTWPKNRVEVEEFIKPGYADYVLKRSNGDNILFVEAKRAGKYFTLPREKNLSENSCYKNIGQLMTDPDIKEAVLQVRTYCMDTGCEYAAITNGFEWIFFKVFEKGKRWDTLKAFVVRSLDFFVDEHTEATNSFSYYSIIEHASLVDLLSSSPPRDRDVYFAKERIPAYSHSINSNRLAEFLRPIINNLFGVIKPDQTEFMDKCYVSERDYAQAARGMHTMIQDSLTPYFKDRGVTQLQENAKGGELGGRITRNLIGERGGEVLVLFGGKGAGKSTFIRRLLHHSPPNWLKNHSQIAIIDLLKVPEDHGVIRKSIWSSIVEQLDSSDILSMTRDTLLRSLFSDRFQLAKKQDLAGYSEESTQYNERLNGLVAEWKADWEYCSKRLCKYWSEKGRGAVIVIDNTDQFPGRTQDYCFAVAQEVCDALGCVTLISMREERFYNSKIHGLLDAYQNSGFHISSPQPSTVFIKRLEYTTDLLRSPKRRVELTSSNDLVLIEEACKYLDIVANGFKHASSPLNVFLSASGHGDIRLSLDLFRKFLLSGYTNVGEMLAAGNWNFLIHQVIKPVMTPTRFFYDERQSDIPNIFQLRDGRHASHFTALRILRRLMKGLDSGEPKFYDVAELRLEFSEKFQMIGDLECNLDILLKHGFIEANNRVDAYDDSVDKVKITNYGQYVSSELYYSFTYMDIVCVDCGVFDQSLHNYIVESSKDEYKLFNEAKRTERVKLRLGRVEEFLKYLNVEEIRENETYALGARDDELFTFKALREFSDERERILASAIRQSNKNGRRPTRQ